jgi:hypothetical protein
MSLSVKLTCCANGWTSIAGVLIPSLQKFVPMIFDDSLDRPQLVRSESDGTRQRHGIQPKLCEEALPLHMYVRWLASLIAVKVKPVRPASQYRWHRLIGS